MMNCIQEAQSWMIQTTWRTKMKVDAKEFKSFDGMVEYIRNRQDEFNSFDNEGMIRFSRHIYRALFDNRFMIDHSVIMDKIEFHVSYLDQSDNMVGRLDDKNGSCCFDTYDEAKQCLNDYLVEHKPKTQHELVVDKINKLLADYNASPDRRDKYYQGGTDVLRVFLYWYKENIKETS